MTQSDLFEVLANEAGKFFNVNELCELTNSQPNNLRRQLKKLSILSNVELKIVCSDNKGHKEMYIIRVMKQG